MSITTYDPDEIQVAGNVLIALGAGFADIHAPKLSELSIIATCPIESFDTATDVAMKAKQCLGMANAQEIVDKRTRKLSPITIKSNTASEAAVLALLAEDAQVGFFVRPQVPSDQVLAVSDPGWAFNARVAKIDPLAVSVGNDFAWVVEFAEVTRDLTTVLAA